MIQTEQCMFMMQGVWRSNVDHIHIRIGYQILITAMHMLSRKLFCKSTRVFDAAGGDCRKFCPLNQRQVGGEFPCYPATTQNAPANEFPSDILYNLGISKYNHCIRITQRRLKRKAQSVKRKTSKVGL